LTTITKAHTHAYTKHVQQKSERIQKKKEKFHINKRMTVETITNIKHKTIIILVSFKGKVKVG